MSRKPNYVSFTIVCGRCRETIYFPSNFVYGLLAYLLKFARLLACSERAPFSTADYLHTFEQIKQFEDKYEYLYGEE